MAFDFPNSPTEGTQFAPTGGPVYVYTGGVWKMQGTSQVVTAEARNRVVNGAMQVSQENSNTAATTNAYFPADQWQLSFSSTGTFTTQRVQSVTPNGSKDRIRSTVSVADAALAAGDFFRLITVIEGIRAADFRYGSASAKQSILRFGFKGPAGTYSVALNNGGSNRSYVANFTVSAGQANTDTEQVIVIPGDTTGTWATDSTVWAYVSIVLAAGTTFQGAAGWQGGAMMGTASNTNGMATAGAVYELFDVGLYLDPNNTGTPPPWQMPDEAQELEACHRYYEKRIHTVMPATATPQGNNGSWVTEKRTTPALSLTFDAGSGAVFAALDTKSYYQSAAHSAIATATITASSRM